MKKWKIKYFINGAFPIIKKFNHSESIYKIFNSCMEHFKSSKFIKSRIPSFKSISMKIHIFRVYPIVIPVKTIKKIVQFWWGKTWNSKSGKTMSWTTMCSAFIMKICLSGETPCAMLLLKKRSSFSFQEMYFYRTLELRVTIFQSFLHCYY